MYFSILKQIYFSQKIKTTFKTIRYHPSIDSALKKRLCRIFLKKLILLERLIMVLTYSRGILKIKIN